MITMSLEWREVLWWMQGGMAGSHLRWSVYEDMVDRVWPQASEQERRNMWLIMRRDLGTYWRPDGWNGHEHMTEQGEGEWRVITAIDDSIPWTYFRQVLARFDPDNQYAVSVQIKNDVSFRKLGVYRDSIIKMPSPPLTEEGQHWESDTASVVLRTYKWQDKYYIDWSRRCAEDLIVKAEKLDIRDDGTM